MELVEDKYTRFAVFAETKRSNAVYLIENRLPGVRLTACQSVYY
jgi:hypothetical protein